MAILGAVARLRNCFGVYSHSAKLLIFMFHSILPFDFDFILVSIFGFLDPNGLFLGWGKAHNLYLGRHHKAEKLLFPMLPLIPTLTFYLILGHFLAFLCPIGPFWKSG